MNDAMKLLSRVVPVLALLTFLAGGLIVAGRSADRAPAQEETAVIDPRVTEALETKSGVKVFISLRAINLPMSEWTPELNQQDAVERQARVLGILNESDFVLTLPFDGAPAIAGELTQSGLDKLAAHPDVAAIALDTPGKWHELSTTGQLSTP